MFNPEFFPTPRAVIKRMLKKISGDAIHFLDPSAGKGDIARAITDAMGDDQSIWDEIYSEEYEDDETERGQRIHERRTAGYYYRRESNRRKCDCIESDPDLVATLRGHELPIVGYDWLTYPGISHYDAIVMNPPFSQGAKHLLHAWDFLYDGQIVCLLNQETIDNPYTAERQRLVALIAQHGGTVERLGDCFSTAERKTDVEVVMVYLKKVTAEDPLDLWGATSSKEKDHEGAQARDIDETMLAIRDNLGNMEHYYNMVLAEMFTGLQHIRRASVYMDALGVTGAGSDPDNKDGGHVHYVRNLGKSRAGIIQWLRKAAWKHVLNQFDFHKWLDSKQADELVREIERDMTVPFTADNIRATLENVFLQRGKLFEKSVWNVFTALTSHYKGNTTGDVGSGDGQSGWKSNDSYKVNKKLVFPYGCRFSSYGSGHGSFDLYSNREAGAVYMDLDRVLARLDGKPFDQTYTVCGALQAKFQNTKLPGTCESTYFHIRYFKKGTVHLTWKRMDLLQDFSIKAAAGRKWVGERTQDKGAAA